MPRASVTLARLALTAPEPTPDAPLLRAFVAARSEDAFAELVRRHGPMVLAVCRRVLGNRDDADDAFQGTFLVLAHKANTIRGANLAGWLYAVAVRTARGVRIMRERRRKYEACANPGRPAEHVPADPDLSTVIDEELARLPRIYREAVVLCELRGHSRKAAAAELGILEGTLSSRLAAAKRKLAARLSARGVTMPAGVIAALAPATVSAALVQSAVFAVRGMAAPIATAAASVVVKAMLFDQLKAVALAAVVLLTTVCGGWAMTGTPGDTPAAANAPAPRATVDAAAKLVEQLGSEDFATREAAEKELRKLGMAADKELRTGLASEKPEVRERAARVLRLLRADAREALAKGFNPAKDTQPDHPVWNRFKQIAGDSKASRDLFARIIKNAAWLGRLDVAGDEREAAARQYRDALDEIARRAAANASVTFHISVWPCDGDDEAAFLLFLGSHPGAASWYGPASAGRDAAAEGERRLHYAQGLPIGLAGKRLELDAKFNIAPVAAAAGTDRVFARLLAAWLHEREPDADMMPPMLWLAAKYDVKEVLPLARTIAAEKFIHDRQPPPALYPAALAVLARMGTAADLPLFERWFTNTMVAGQLESSVPPGATPPPPVSTQVRDAAVALALLLFDRDPAEFGFEQAAKLFARTGGRPTVGQYDHYQLHHFGFADDKARTAAHAKAKAFLDKQKLAPKKNEPKPAPAVLKLVEQLGSEDFATREAAGKALREIGEPAVKSLQAAAASDTSPEVRTRAADLVKAITSPTYGQLLRFDGHTGLVGGVAFFPTGDRLLTSGYDATYRIWDAKTGKPIDERSTGTKESQVGGPAAVSPDGKRVAARYFVADADTGKFLFGLEGHTGKIVRIAYSTDSKRIVTASHDGTVRVWDADGKELKQIDAHMGQKVDVASSGEKPQEPRYVNRGALDAAFSPDGKRVASGGVDGTVRIWDVETAKELQKMNVERATVMAVAFLPDGRRVASAGSDGVIHIWNAATGKELGKYAGHTGAIAALAVTGDGKLLVSAGHDKTVRVWDVATGKERRCFRGHTAAVQAVAVSPDGKTALSGGEDNTARLWALPTAP